MMLNLKKFFNNLFFKERQVKDLVKWKDVKDSVRKDENFIEFIDTDGKRWFQTFTFSFVDIDTIKDVEHEQMLMHLVIYEFRKNRHQLLPKCYCVGNYLTIRGIVNSSNEIWSIKKIEERYSIYPIALLYTEALL